MSVVRLSLARAIERALERGVADVFLRPSRYESSHPLFELDLRLTDGTLLELVLKDGATLSDHAAKAKPAFVLDPRREVDVYRRLLGPARVAAPRLFAVVAWGGSSGWLVLERVPGLRLADVGDFATWEATMRLLARTHRALERVARPPLPRYDRAFYRRWLDRAESFHGARVAPLRAPYERALSQLEAMPATVLHGELYATNVLVDGARVVPVDWESVALGPAIVDLAAITSGSWSGDARSALSAVYFHELGGGRWPSEERFSRDLDCCRVFLAVQWLGWSASWAPPPDQDHDWLAEGLAAAERLG